MLLKQGMGNGEWRMGNRKWKSNMFFLLKWEIGNGNFKSVRFLLKRNLIFSAAIITFFSKRCARK